MLNNRKKKKRKLNEYLMTKANAEDFFLQGIQFGQEGQESADPSVISMGISATPGDDKAVVALDLVILGKLAAGHAVEVPSLAFLRQHFDKNPKIPTVHLLHKVRVLCAQQNPKFLPTHNLSLSVSLRKSNVDLKRERGREPNGNGD